MGQRNLSAILAILLLVVLAAGSVQARTMLRPDDRKNDAGSKSLAQLPVHCLVGHRVGQIVLAVANNGTFGARNPADQLDYFTGQAVPDCEFPKGSNITYLYTGAFWIGAVVGRDTLVSVGADGWQWDHREMYADVIPFGEIVKRSILDPTAPEFEDAISEEDYIAVYTDTLTNDVPSDFFGRPHTPLNIEVTQASYAWSYSYAEDFILFDYQIKNIGQRTLVGVYMGVYVDADVAWESAGTGGSDDDVVGFLRAWPDTFMNQEYIDSTIFTAWIADNDGDYERGWGTDNQIQPCPAVTATRIIRTPAESLEVSFNWWIGNGDAALDFGPRERPGAGQWQEDFRNFRTGGLGTPEGDLNKYYVMRNREFDYSQCSTGVIQQTDPLWMYPPANLSGAFAKGYDTRYLLSFGPFEINPGQTLPISFAYVAGDNLHNASNPTNTDNLPHDPHTYLKNLNFADLAKNSRWASWVYDNPGVDTDGDGYRGECFRVPSDSELVTTIDTIIDTTVTPPDTTIIQDAIWAYDCYDTLWIQGDGVPDWKGASPPPAPTIWLNATTHSIKVRFNGVRSETEIDVFSGEVDFEGYRVYMARDTRAASFFLLTSYDREDYNKLVRVGDDFVLRDVPFTLEELRCLYADGDDPCNNDDWHPLDFFRTEEYPHPDFPLDSVFIFESQDFNMSRLGIDTRIEKRFPNQPYPSTLDPTFADPSELTEDGYFKHFEYEMEITDLLPTVEYYVNVTAFDYGSPVSGLESLETPVSLGAKLAYALPAWGEVQDEELDVFVYPNPYRQDGDYRARGIEGRMRDDFPADRVRAIHFANLPPKCVIRIFTLDGDMVREIEHDVDPSAGYATHETWNLITRNTQLTVTGLYYWVVEAPGRETQIGKLAIIM